MLASFAVSLLILSSTFAQDWPQWRGPNRDGTLSVSAAFPTDLKNLTKAWSVSDLGPSYSGPIVADGMVFTTATVANKTEVVTAYRLEDGTRVWTRDWAGAMSVPFFAAKNGSWIRSTPAYFQGKLYVGGMRDYLVCLDAKTGVVDWKADFTADAKSPLPAFGFVCSPLVDESGVYVQAGSSFAKLDRKTGKVLWQTLKDDGGTLGSAFSSPIRVKSAGRDQFIVQTRTKLAGVAADDGSVLWVKEIPSFRGMNILTPQPYGTDELFTSTYGGKSQLIRLGVSGSTIAPESKWAINYEGHMTSPVVVGDVAYLLGKDQKFIAFDLKAGKEAWRSEKRFGIYWSLIACGDKILALDQRGILFLVKADPNEFEIIDEKKIADSESWAHLAVAGKLIVVRDLNSLTAYKFAK